MNFVDLAAAVTETVSQSENAVFQLRQTGSHPVYHLPSPNPSCPHLTLCAEFDAERRQEHLGLNPVYLW